MVQTQAEASFKYNHSEKGIQKRKEYEDSHKNEKKERMIKYRDSNRELLREKGRKYMKDNYEEHKKYMREIYYPRNPEPQRNRSREFRKTDDYPLTSKRRKIEIMTEVFGHYSNGNIKCMISDEYSSHPGFDVTDIEVLSIDHINGDGAKHRKEIGKLGGQHFYLWLIKQGFPEGYRVLCLNCQHKEALRLKLYKGTKEKRYKYPTTAHSTGQDQLDILSVSPAE